jgi:hypothetical protein
MKALKQLHLNSVWLLLIVFSLALLFAPTPSAAQTTGLWVDVCSSNQVSYADETVCFYGNVANSAEATASADLTECCYLAEVGVELQVFQDGSLVADTGSPGSTYESVSVTRR